MRRIVKQNEPNEWMRYRLTPGVQYQSIPSLVDSLLEEQGHLCAYCQRRIYKHPDKHRIEHLKCRDRYPERQLDYNNMVICCNGILEDEEQCDRKKENKDISFNLFSDSFARTIQYAADGTISSTDKTYNTEFNDVLNLNHALLKSNRKETWLSVLSQLKAKGFNRTNLKQMLDVWNSKDKLGMYHEFNGIIVYFLERKLNKLNKQ